MRTITLLTFLHPVVTHKLMVKSGHTVNLTVEGDISDGCRFLFFLTDGTCCYSADWRKDTLCDPFQQPAKCRSKRSFTVQEQPGVCIFQIQNFQYKDSGTYQAIFPSNLRHNAKIQVILIMEEKSEGIWVPIVLISVGIICSVTITLWLLSRKGMFNGGTHPELGPPNNHFPWHLVKDCNCTNMVRINSEPAPSMQICTVSE